MLFLVLSDRSRFNKDVPSSKSSQDTPPNFTLLTVLRLPPIRRKPDHAQDRCQTSLLTKAVEGVGCRCRSRKTTKKPVIPANKDITGSVLRKKKDFC